MLSFALLLLTLQLGNAEWHVKFNDDDKLFGFRRGDPFGRSFNMEKGRVNLDIFTFEYDGYNQRYKPSGEEFKVPKGVTINMLDTMDGAESLDIFKSRSEYLKSKGKSLGAKFGLPWVGLSASSEGKNIKQSIEENQGIYVTSAHAELIYDATMDDRQVEFNENFSEMLSYITSPDWQDGYDIVEDFGTHFVNGMYVGGRAQAWFVFDEAYKNSYDDKETSKSVGGFLKSFGFGSSSTSRTTNKDTTYDLSITNDIKVIPRPRGANPKQITQEWRDQVEASPAVYQYMLKPMWELKNLSSDQKCAICNAAVRKLGRCTQTQWVLKAWTSRASSADTKDIVQAQFLVNGQWTANEHFFDRSAKGELKQRTYQLDSCPTKLKLSMGRSEEDAWGFWKIQLNENVLKESPHNEAGHSIGDNGWTLEGDKTSRASVEIDNLCENNIDYDECAQKRLVWEYGPDSVYPCRPNCRP